MEKRKTNQLQSLIFLDKIKTKKFGVGDIVTSDLSSILLILPDYRLSPEGFLLMFFRMRDHSGKAIDDLLCKKLNINNL